MPRKKTKKQNHTGLKQWLFKVITNPLHLLGVLFMVGITVAVLSIPLWYIVPTPGKAVAGVIDDADRYAWGENIGWVDFKPTGLDIDSQITVGDKYLSGYAWGENIGWLNMGDGSPADGQNYANDSAADFGVNNDGGTLSGYAWGANIGWVNFAPAGGGVSIVDGEFTGYAWGENIGWVSFNCSNDDSCGTADYKVVTTYTPSSIKQDQLAPNDVTNVQTVYLPATQAIKLVWDDPLNTDLTKIFIYRNDPLVSPLVSGSLFASVNPGVESFLDTAVVPNRTYRYIIRTEDLKGNISKSQREYAVVSSPLPTVVEEKTEVKPPVTKEPELPRIGQVVQLEGISTLYYYGRDGVLYPFLHFNIYESWFGDDFSQVNTVSSTVFDRLIIGEQPVIYKPGKYMVKQTTASETYVVDANFVLKHVINEAVATELYGLDWNTKILDIDNFFHDYVVSFQTVYGLNDFDPIGAETFYDNIDDAMGL